MNLLRDNLDNVDFASVQAFLGLDRPPEERPSEGYRFDFKKDLPPELAKQVAAFSNTFGGIIILGVDCDRVEKNKTSYPKSIVGLSGTEYKQRITNVILNSVYPVPLFSIGECRLPNDSGRVVVIVRVEPGSLPPYMDTSRKTVPIRHNDNSIPATYHELEGLFRRRSTSNSKSQPFFENNLFVLETEPEIAGQNPGRTTKYLYIKVLPWDHAPLKLDGNIEGWLERQISGFYIRNKWIDQRHSFQRESRAKRVEFSFVDGNGRVPRKWRLDDDGTLSFVTNLTGIKPERLGDWVLDSFCTLRLARALYQRNDFYGNCHILTEISINAVDVEPTFPCIDHLTPNYDQWSGLNLTKLQEKGRPTTYSVEKQIDYGILENPTESITDIYMSFLREFWGWNRDRQSLNAAVTNLWENYRPLVSA